MWGGSKDWALCFLQIHFLSLVFTLFNLTVIISTCMSIFCVCYDHMTGCKSQRYERLWATKPRICELNPGPLQGQCAFLTDELSVQHLYSHCLIIVVKHYWMERKIPVCTHEFWVNVISTFSMFVCRFLLRTRDKLKDLKLKGCTHHSQFSLNVRKKISEIKTSLGSHIIYLEDMAFCVNL